LLVGNRPLALDDTNAVESFRNATKLIQKAMEQQLVFQADAIPGFPQGTPAVMK
jgi:hypothetical protein